MSSMEMLAEEIDRYGVSMGFGIPGSGASLSLIDALEKHDIPFHLTHFEGAGALIAATVGYLSGRVGLSLSIKGPGLTNAIPGIATSWFESYPLVHITEATAPDAPASQAHKRLDQLSLVSSITKGACYYGDIGGFTALANYAREETPGPVVMNLAPKEVDSGKSFTGPESVEDLSSAALELVRKSSRPIVIAGTAAIRAGLGRILAKVSCPVFSTAAAKGVIDESAPQAAGVYTGVGLSLTPEATLMPEADLVIGIGLSAREVLAAKPFGCDFLAVDTAKYTGSEGFNPTVCTGMGGIDEICDALVSKSAWGIEELHKVLGKLRKRMAERFLPGTVFYAINQHFDRCVRMVMDTGYFCTIGEHAWRAAGPGLCLLSGQGRYMGAGLPMALGAAMHDSKIPTVAVLGDGGIGMYLAEVKLAVRNKLPLLIVLMTDNAFASIRTRAIKDHLSQRPLTMDGQSWTPVFESLGLPSERVASIGAVESALSGWNPASGPAFLEISFQPEPYEAMVQDIR